jgi:hypothetical protein
VQELSERAGDSRQTKLVSDAVINIYAAYVHSLLYSYKHPLITDSLRNAFFALQKAFRTKPLIRLETREGKLMVDGETLEGEPLVLGNFALWLNSMNIKALSFSKDITRRDLIAFHKIISTEKLNIGEISKLMAEKSIVTITVHPVDLSSDQLLMCPPDDTAQKGLVRDFQSTMYYTESRQAESPFFIRPATSGPLEDAAKYGPTGEYENTTTQPESSGDLSPLDTGSTLDAGNQEISEGNRYADCVEALIEKDISEDDRNTIKSIPPLEMAHLLNTMLFRDPGREAVERVINTYFGETVDMYGDDSVDRCRILLGRLKSFLQPSFLSYCAFLFNSNALLPDQADILSGTLQGTVNPSGKGADADAFPEHPAFVPCRTIEGSDFSFDFVARGNGVLHDLEISKETAVLFNKAHLAIFQNEEALDSLSTSIRSAVGDSKLQETIIAECTEEAITDVSFDIVLELIESTSLADDVYRKLEGRISALVELYSEKGDFEKVLDLVNALKTQSLQGKWSDLASIMIRSVFASNKVNTRVVDSLQRYGRKQRDLSFKLTGALRAYIIPYLLDALIEETDTSTRRFIISLLTSFKTEALDHIAKRLRDSSWYVVRNMLYLLRECKGRSYLPAVREFLEHEEPIIRLEALMTLLSFQDPEADTYVKKFLLSDVFQLQKGAVRLTGAYRVKHAVPHLVRLLREKDIRGKKSHFKRGIIRALGRIGDSRAVYHFLNICTSPSGFNKDDFDKLKIEIFRTLHNYPAATIGPLIDYGMHSDNEEIVSISKNLAQRYGLPAIHQGTTS